MASAPNVSAKSCSKKATEAESTAMKQWSVIVTEPSPKQLETGEYLNCLFGVQCDSRKEAVEYRRDLIRKKIYPRPKYTIWIGRNHPSND